MRIALTGWLLWVTLSCALADPVTIAVTGAGGTPIEDAVVALDPLDALAPPSNTPAVAVVDQIHKTFVPHIAVIRTGTAVSFPNSDRIRHQVYSFSPARSFNLKLYAGAAAPPVVFDHAGLVVLGCNIHDTMAAFVAVVDTPYFGRTDPKGRRRLAIIGSESGIRNSPNPSPPARSRSAPTSARSRSRPNARGTRRPPRPGPTDPCSCVPASP
jgi:plastocyanin